MNKKFLGILLSALLLTGCGSDPADPGTGNADKTDPTPTKEEAPTQAAESPSPSVPEEVKEDTGVFAR